MRKTMTEGCIWKSILFFALPIMLGNLLQQLYNTVDGIVVGNYVSQNALAAVGASGTITFLLLAISNGMSSGGSIIVAQYYGANKLDEMRRAVSTLFIMLTSLGVLLTIFGLAFGGVLARGILHITDPEICDMAILYFRVYACGLIVQYVYNAITAILRALGDSKATLYFLCVAAVMNIALDLLLVLKFQMGVFGVAFATVISQVACAAVSILYMLKKYPMFRFKKGEFVFDRTIFKLALRMGIPATIQQTIISLGNILIQRLVNGFGADTMAAFTVGHRVESYVMLPLFAFNMSISVFAGQNVGAGKLDRAKKGLRSTIIMNCLFSLALSPLLYVFGAQLSALFGTGGEALRQAVEMIRYMSYVLVIFSAYYPCSGFLQGAGDAIMASVSSFTTLGMRVLCSYALAYVFHIGYRSAWLAMPVGWVCSGVIAYTRFFRGKWKTKAIVKHDEGAQASAEELPE